MLDVEVNSVPTDEPADPGPSSPPQIIIQVLVYARQQTDP